MRNNGQSQQFLSAPLKAACEEERQSQFVVDASKVGLGSVSTLSSGSEAMPVP